MASEEINIRTTTAAKVVVDPKLRAEMKAKLVRVLERGHLSQRLDVVIPGKHLEWSSKDPVEISRLQSMGFKICQDESLMQNALHNDGTKNITVGDVVLMECSLETKELIDEARAELSFRRHGKKVKQEESDFMARMNQVGLPTINESSQDSVDGASLKSIIGA